jgi:hypothetical protein
MRTNPSDRRSHGRHRYGVRAGFIQDSSWNLILRTEESASGQQYDSLAFGVGSGYRQFADIHA